MTDSGIHKHWPDDGIWALVTAAGSGQRMQASVPKQYLPLDSVPLLLQTLSRVVAWPCLRELVVVSNTADKQFEQLRSSIDTLMPTRETNLAIEQKMQWHTVVGGESRAHSVSNGLSFIRKQAGDNAWVMVHDAARPLVRHDDVEQLASAVFDACEKGEVSGGLLANRVTDTIKQSAGYDAPNHRTDKMATVQSTIDRQHLWQAQTPQLFQVGALADAIDAALESGLDLTDEASAMEHAGRSVLMVEGSTDNIKVTRAGDLELAGFLLSEQRLAHDRD